MPELLTGTVTFLFSDIEGSTRVLQSQGAAWPALLERHRELLRTAFVAHGGQEVGTEGDSFFVAFPTATGAVAAAVEAQRALFDEPWPDGAEIRVRMGLHTGEASLSTDSYVGLHVHRASRIASVAHGGQVLLSDATRALLGSELDDGPAVRDLGELRLKDLERPEHLFQLVIPGLPSDFPALTSIDAVPTNLPAWLTTFLGRERQIAEVQALLGEHRLVTLTGPGGTGKTRLSLEVAARDLEHHPAGVWYVELADVTDPDQVPDTIARTIGLPDRGGRSAIDRVIDHIADRRVLLVLDNFEQVLDAGPSVNRLVRECRSLRVLASSRSALRVAGEQEYPVPPLGLPDPERLPPVEQLSTYESVALFVERARAVRPDFAVTNENAPAVAEICVRLDGLPLAIELAAARVRILTPQAMLSRLANRLGLLATSGVRDLPERQQTLRGAIAWSYDLLDETDRTLFASLSVFARGAILEAIERVCAPDVSGDVIDALGSLVDKSLVKQREGIGGEPRFTMLETIHEYAAERASELGSLPALRDRHAAYFGELAAEAATHLLQAGSKPWLDRLEEESGNLRSALEWLPAAGRTEEALRLSARLWRYWQIRGHLAEGLARVEAALALPDAGSFPAARADALSAAAGLAYWEGASDQARAFYVEEIALRREIGDRPGLAEALYGISFTWSINGLATDDELALATTHIEEALEIYRELGDDEGIGKCEWALANVTYIGRDIAAARRHAEHALMRFEQAGDRFMVGWANFTIGLADLADDHLAGGRPEALAAARERFAFALRVFAEADDVSGYTLVLDAIAVQVVRSGDRPLAARLSAAVARLERETGTGLNLWTRNQLGFDPAELRTDPALADDWAAGERLSAAEAVALVLGEAPQTERAAT